MVSQAKGGARRSTVTRGEIVLWGVFLALGIWLTLNGVLPALDEGRQQEQRVRRLEEQTDRLVDRRDRLRMQREALRGDPGVIERTLRDRGYTPEGAVRVVEEGNDRGR